MDENISKLLNNELEALIHAIDRFERQTEPRTPAPRKREFLIFADGDRRAVIPVNRESSYRVFTIFRAGRPETVDKRELLNFISATGPTPRKLYETLRNIRAAREWHEARAEGRKRAAAEILRQQAKWVQKLEDELTLKSLGS